jgi:hypothetical protein
MDQVLRIPRTQDLTPTGPLSSRNQTPAEPEAPRVIAG